MPVGILRFGVWLIVGLLAAVFGHHTSIPLFSWGIFSGGWLWSYHRRDRGCEASRWTERAARLARFSADKREIIWKVKPN